MVPHMHRTTGPIDRRESEREWNFINVKTRARHTMRKGRKSNLKKRKFNQREYLKTTKMICTDNIRKCKTLFMVQDSSSLSYLGILFWIIRILFETECGTEEVSFLNTFALVPIV